MSTKPGAGTKAHLKDYTVGLFIWMLDEAFCMEHVKAKSAKAAAEECLASAKAAQEEETGDGLTALLQYTPDDIDVLFVIEGTHHDARSGEQL